MKRSIKQTRKQQLREGTVLAGFFWGLVAGGVLSLVRGPRFRPVDTVNQVASGVQAKLSTLGPSDPVQEGIEEGKAAARRRLAELGQPPAI